MALFLVDTNVVIRVVDRRDPQHGIARAAVRTLRAAGHTLLTASQCFIEAWRVATRPTDRNGLGLSTAEADHELRLMERIFPRLPDTDDVYPHWRHLVVSCGVAGIQTHDTRLVAVMLAYGATHILTFNGTDFHRFAGPAGIVVVDPATV